MMKIPISEKYLSSTLPGFHPTDGELITYYLHRKISNIPSPVELVPQISLYDCEPWQFPALSKFTMNGKEWYFFNLVSGHKKGRSVWPNESRAKVDQETPEGQWTSGITKREILVDGKIVGWGKNFTFYARTNGGRKKTNWYMMEYRCSKDDYIYPKVSTTAIPKVGQSILNGETSSSKLNTSSGCLSLPGFLFHPKDNELMYLKRKVLNLPIHNDAISEIDLYKWAPWDLPSQFRLKHKTMQQFFVNFHDRTHSRSYFNVNNQDVEGYWSSGTDLPVRSTSTNAILGVKKIFMFHLGKYPDGKKTYWIMHEYRLKEDDDQIGSSTPFTVGSMAEVAYGHENVPVAWYTAAVTEIICEKVLLVEYLSLKIEDGSLLRETVSIQNIRPCPPSIPEVRYFQLLDIVEAFYNSRWWQGVIAAVKDRTKYNVKLMLLEDEIVSSNTELRVGYGWINEEWILASQDESLESQNNVESLHACSPLNKCKDPDPVATSMSNVDIYGLLPLFKKNKNDQESRRPFLGSKQGRKSETAEDSTKLSVSGCAETSSNVLKDESLEKQNNVES